MTDLALFLGISTHNLSELCISFHCPAITRSAQRAPPEKCFHRFKFLLLQCEGNVPVSYTGCPGCKGKSLCVQQVLWFQHNTAEQNSAGGVLCVLFSPSEQPGNLGHFCISALLPPPANIGSNSEWGATAES